jgi:molybdopterin biosynthesis enzyme MoaB
LSRASAGTVGRTLVVSLPGSVKAVRLGVARVLAPMLPHAIDQVSGRRLQHP